jgi:hypothetical protein
MMGRVAGGAESAMIGWREKRGRAGGEGVRRRSPGVVACVRAYSTGIESDAVKWGLRPRAHSTGKITKRMWPTPLIRRKMEAACP